MAHVTIFTALALPCYREGVLVSVKDSIALSLPKIAVS